MGRTIQVVAASAPFGVALHRSSPASHRVHHQAHLGVVHQNITTSYQSRYKEGFTTKETPHPQSKPASLLPIHLSNTDPDAIRPAPLGIAVVPRVVNAVLARRTRLPDEPAALDLLHADARHVARLAAAAHPRVVYAREARRADGRRRGAEAAAVAVALGLAGQEVDRLGRPDEAGQRRGEGEAREQS